MRLIGINEKDLPLRRNMPRTSIRIRLCSAFDQARETPPEMRPKGSQNRVLSWAYHRRDDSATILKELMSTQANTIRLDADVIAALREAAEREHKSLEEMAGEAIMRGLSADRDAEWRELIASGHEQGKKSGIREEDVPELVRDWRRNNRQTS